MCKRATIIHGVCRAILSGVAIVGLHVSAAEVPNAAPNAAPKKAVPKAAARASMDSVHINFSPDIVVTACNGNVATQWNSQGIEADHATGNFDFNLSPSEPNVLNLKGNVNATTFNAALKCATGTGGPTGTITATGSGNSYTGTYVLGSSTGNVTITLTSGGGGGDNTSVNASVSPNPGVAGQPVFFKGTVTPGDPRHVVDALDRATITWGDGVVETIDGPTILPKFKAGTLSHTYLNEGVYNLNLYLDRVGDPPGNGASFDFFVVIGAASVSVNSASGASITSLVGGGGNVALTIDATPVVGATGATTTFEDADGMTLTPNAPLVGFSVGQTIPTAGLVVGTSLIQDVTNATLTTAKKTVGISAFSLGTPGALTPPMNVSIVSKSMKGKFYFNSGQTDSVIFSGQFVLPQGFTLALSDAHSMQFSIGNVVDTVMLDSKGNAPRGLRGRIKKLTVKIPKLKTGVAVGTEIVKINMEYNAANLTGAGLGSEGIVLQRGTNENGLKVVTRFVQLNMYYVGVAYESLIAVNYSLSPKSDFGTIQGRH
ncbi:MAG: hypothetical protein WCT04_12010 [Planctomycetota bacterium]